MGLSGPKTKQRIPKDPRNLNWSQDALRFGHTYLAKLGWSSGLGLGANKDGRVSHVSVAQKRDNLGVGAGRDDDIAWKQQNDFEAMLARLNSSASGTTDDSGNNHPSGTPSEAQDSNEGISLLPTCGPAKDESGVVVEAETSRPIAPAPRRFAHHRKRMLEAKNISKKSASELAQVLGMPSSSGATTPNDPPPSSLTPIANDITTTSTVSISDYFKQKMEKLGLRERRAPVNDPAEGGASSSEDELPRIGLGHRKIMDRSTEDMPVNAQASMSSPNKSKSSSGSLPPTSTIMDPAITSESPSQSSSVEPSQSPPVAEPRAHEFETRSEKKKKDKRDKRDKGTKRSNDNNETSREAQNRSTEGASTSVQLPRDLENGAALEPNGSSGSMKRRKHGGGRDERPDEDEDRRIRKERKKRRKLEQSDRL
ncbi:uncharacterized protein EI90DRAFT_3057837 [Cantharellus anzutake]|uniref:uncharacterized protein n=1 Tax=Cantharellus anzutake TaxID=1750568 RepID=UPI001908578D|nr:uncharacterized protein EI90DRAFT_3057837 [Cantharellus anzutake]KAF8331403.1 hypothetical protein EI90DRAFT_3057837 [Cantharellus anzutake]